MPFKSKAQQRKCYALKAQGKAGTWDCDEWAEETENFSKLPEKVKEESKMENIQRFVKFLDDIKTPETDIVVESVKKAFTICFEEDASDGSFDVEEDTPAGMPPPVLTEDETDTAELIEKEMAVDAEKKELAEKQQEIKEAEKELAAEKVANAEEDLEQAEENLDVKAEM